jgi:hypothetical protein
MDKYERQTELRALNATLETVYHEIEKNAELLTRQRIVICWIT